MSEHHDDSQAATTATATIGTTYQHHHHHHVHHISGQHPPPMGQEHEMMLLEVGTTNKWSKNAFGDPVPKTSGKFSREESEMVRKAVEEYCAAKKIPTTQLCVECDHKAELKGAWQEISKKLPHRSVQSIYRHGIRQLHPFKRGAWSEQECELLQDLVAKLGKKWSAIQSQLKRSADSCRDKYREMSDEYIKGKWKEEDIEQLKKVIRDVLSVPSDRDMKEIGKMVEDRGIVIPWITVSTRMGMRSRLSCFKKWQKLITGEEPKRKRDENSEDYGSNNVVGTESPQSKLVKVEENNRFTGSQQGTHPEKECVPLLNNNTLYTDAARTAGSAAAKAASDHAVAAAAAATALANHQAAAESAAAAAAAATALANHQAATAAAATASANHQVATESATAAISLAHHHQATAAESAEADAAAAAAELDDIYSAKIAAETVEAVDLPDAHILNV